MNANWIVSANASRARFFAQEKPSAPLEEINDMVNDGVRERILDVAERDKRGPTSATKSAHNTGGALPNKLYQAPQTPDQHMAELFARDIADYLLKAHQEGRFKQLTLIVSPQFLGVLRTLLDPQLESAVRLEINKDYTHFNAKQLLEQIRTMSAKG